jgi:hypothetical protein
MFPDPLVTRQEKATPEYGYKYASAIWAKHVLNATLFTTKTENDKVSRKYREGMQSIEHLKNLLEIGGDNSYTNLDFSPINRIPTLIDNTIGRLMKIDLKMSCNPIDPESQSKFDDYKKELFANMYLKKNGGNIEQLTGIPLTSENKYIPKTKEEADLHLSSFKMDTCIAMEQALLWVNKQNFSEKQRAKILDDLLTIDKAAIQYWYDENWNIKWETVDPIDVITPYSKYDDFRNLTYVAVIKQYQLWQIAQMNPEFTDEELWNIALFNQGKNVNPTWNWGTSYENYYVSNTVIKPYYNFNISVLEFYFITQNAEVRVKKRNSKGGYFFDKKSDNYVGEAEILNKKLDSLKKEVEGLMKSSDVGINKDEKEARKVRIEAKKIEINIVSEQLKNVKSETITKKCAYTYGGKWVIGTKYLWDYQMLPNQYRDKYPDGSYSPKAELPIILIAPRIRDMENKSTVEKLKSLEDLMQLAHLRLQQYVIKAVPPGVFIDIRGLDGVILANGVDATPLEILKMYQQTGSVVGNSIDKFGDVINGRIVEPLPNGIAAGIEKYIELQQSYLRQMDMIVGFNSSIDSAQPNPNTGLGIQKMAEQSTLNALYGIFMSQAELLLKKERRLALMIQDCAEHNFEAFSSALGNEAAEVLKVGKDLSLSVFGIELEAIPDDNEKMQLEQLLQLGLQNGSLFPSDVIRVRQEMKSDVKKAARLLVMLEDKNRTDAQESKDKDIQNNGQIQQQSIQTATQAKQQEMQLEVQTKTQMLQAEYKMKEDFEQKQFEREMQLQGLRNQGTATVAEIGAGSIK